MIENYFKNYKDYSFQEKPFNEVDAMVFSFLAYATYQDVLKTEEKLSLKEVANRQLALGVRKKKEILAITESNKMLQKLKNYKRYQDCLLFHYEYIGNTQVQFCAISFEYLKNHVFVAFEGTNSLLSGWKENFLLGCEFPTLSHRMAIEYLNRHFTYNFYSLIIGGHSKGGNLALVAGMYSHFLVRLKIRKIYSGDGPGLLDREFQSFRYRSLKKKYVHLIPNYSVVGVLLNHSNDQVVSSPNKSILSHFLIYWEVEEDHFKRANISSFSKELDHQVSQWIKKTSLEDKKELVKNFTKLTEKANVQSIDELIENKTRIFQLLWKSKDMSTTTKNAVSEFIQIIITCVRKTQKEEFSLLMTNLFKWGHKNGTK